MTTSVRQRVQKRRDTLRAAGLRPVQILGFRIRAGPGSPRSAAASPGWSRRPTPSIGIWRPFSTPASRTSMTREAREARRSRGRRARGRLRQAPAGGDRPVRIDFEGTGTVTVLLLSGTLVDAPLLRPEVSPTPENGLRKPSQVMVDKAMTVRRSRVGEPFGRLDDATMLAVTRSLSVFLGMA